GRKRAPDGGDRGLRRGEALDEVEDDAAHERARDGLAAAQLLGEVALCDVVEEQHAAAACALVQADAGDREAEAAVLVLEDEIVALEFVAVREGLELREELLVSENGGRLGERVESLGQMWRAADDGVRVAMLAPA